MINLIIIIIAIIDDNEYCKKKQTISLMGQIYYANLLLDQNMNIMFI